MTRSATASTAGPGGGGTAGARGGAGAWAKAFDAKINPAAAGPNLVSTFFIISFSIGLVRFSQELSNL